MDTVELQEDFRKPAMPVPAIPPLSPAEQAAEQKCRALRERIEGIREAQRILRQGKQVARWEASVGKGRRGYEALWAICRAIEWLGRERKKAEAELAQLEDEATDAAWRSL